MKLHVVKGVLRNGYINRAFYIRNKNLIEDTESFFLIKDNYCYKQLPCISISMLESSTSHQ
jgi:hypothetical protein